MLGAHLSYKVLPYLTLSGRVRIDNSNTSTTDKRYATTNEIMSDGSSNGWFGTARYKDKQIYADFLASFSKDLGDDFNLQANFGGSISDMRFESLDVHGAISDGKGSYEGHECGSPQLLRHHQYQRPPLEDSRPDGANRPSRSMQAPTSATRTHTT